MSEWDGVATRLRNAYTQGAIESLRDVLDATDVESAYRVQSTNTDYWTQQGRVVSGYKVGLTAKAVQQQLGVDQPDFGVLYSDMQILSGGTLDMTKLISPRAEAEVALVLAEDICCEDVSVDQVAESVAYASPAIEIVDSRILDWNITFADTVADNGSSAMYVLGAERLPVGGLDLFSCGMVLQADGDVVSLGVGAACLGHPFNSLAWLAKTLVSRGQTLSAGSVILTGALGPMVDLAPNQRISARIGGLGEVSFESGGLS